LKYILYTSIFFGFEGVEEIAGFVKQLLNIIGLRDEICLETSL